MPIPTDNTQGASGSIIFDPLEWIGNGKKFDEFDLPTQVQQALEQLLSVPSPFNETCTCPELSVQSLLAAKLPRLDVARVSRDPRSCFSRDMAANPRCNKLVAMFRPISFLLQEAL